MGRGERAGGPGCAVDWQPLSHSWAPRVSPVPEGSVRGDVTWWRGFREPSGGLCLVFAQHQARGKALLRSLNVVGEKTVQLTAVCVST